ncbi:MAG: peptidylprolyl isomerase [Candidatus Cryptobacteroides sp.]|nr:peptidylprolyl isomerase [Bacteroidales bacterium]
MKIEKNKVAVLRYELEVDGEIVDKSLETKPLDYIHGTNMLLPAFEANIEGKEPGENFDFILSPEEGYGEFDPKKQFDIPKSSFESDGVLQEDLLVVGKRIPMLNSSGMVCLGIVKAVKEDSVTMDFNQFLAGKTLHFRGEIISVREATEKELTEGLHGEFLPNECHCSGGCHGGCHGEGDGCCGEGKEDGCCGGHGEGNGCCGGHGEGHCHCNE